MRAYRILTIIPPQWVFMGGLFLLAASLPLSVIGMSMGQFMMAWGWLLSPDLRSRTHALVRNRLLWVLASIYLVHVLFLLNSSDFSWALKDLRIKLPLLLLPVFLGSGPPLKKEIYRYAVLTFIAAVLAASLISTCLAMVRGIGSSEGLSPFISHIRFSMEVCLAIAFLVVLALRQRDRRIMATQLVMALWLFLFLFILKAFTGIMIFGAVLWISMAYAVFMSRRRLYRGLTLITLIVLSIVYITAFRQVRNEFFQSESVDYAALEHYTSDGNLYTHDTANLQSIRGHRVWLYLAEQEMRHEWNLRSAIPYDSLCTNGMTLRNILIRYLSSKGERKDGLAIRSLSDEEVMLVEGGRAFYDDGWLGPMAERISDAGWSWTLYRQNGDATGNSVVQRVELWKTGAFLFRSVFWTGTGTGDVKKDFAAALQDRGSSLTGSPLRAHSQWLTFGISFGILGLLWMLAAFFYPLLARSAWRLPMYLVFFLVIVISMLAEDTLETQAGATMMAFFNSLLLLHPHIDPHHPGREGEEEAG